MLIDTHIHLDDPCYGKDRDAVIARAREEGVDYLIVVASDLESSKKCVKLAEEFDSLYATVGIHPHEAKTADKDTYLRLKELAKCKKVVAIGEIGLDYHYNHSPKEVQREVFRNQIRLAKKLTLPIIIHHREALPDVIEIVKQEKIKEGVFHCFSGSLEEAEEVISLGFYVSIAGPVTFKNAKRLQELVKELPLDKLLIETDGPYLSPHPFRGKRNESAYLKYIAEKIAELRNLTLEEIAQKTTENAKKLFRLEYSSILKDLNERQKEAVKWVQSPVLILSGPGSGKTRVITHRIAYLIKELGVDPFNILAVTFTNKAANEMKERVAKLLKKEYRDIWIATFHSTCARILRHDIYRIGFDRNFVIYDDLDQLNLIKECLKELDIDPKEYRAPAFASAICRAKENLIDYQSYLIYTKTREDFYREMASRVYEHYQKKLFKNNALDFDDLIMKTVELFREKPEVLEKYQERFIHILVDEYQDTNHAQYAFTKLLASKYKNISVVGDEDQAIYKFRGADIRNILEFEKDYKDCHSVVFVLNMMENYRSTQPIIDLANNLIVYNEERCKDKGKIILPDEEKKPPSPGGLPPPRRQAGKRQKEKVPAPVLQALPNEFEEAEYVVDEARRLHKKERIPYHDMAVFYRVNAQSRVLEDAFRKTRIPYNVVGALGFYEHREIKDILAYLRVLVNSKDSLSLKRIMNVPPRGIGKVTVQRIVDFANKNKITLWEGIRKVEKMNNLSPRTEWLVKNFRNLIFKYMELAKSLGVGELIKKLIKEIGYIKRLEKEDTFTSEMRIENLKELMDAANQFEEKSEDKSTQAFLEDVSLISEVDTWDDKAKAVTLMTLHNAKGLEFDTVFITGMEEGFLPHSNAFSEERELEEERRLCYVGITRAKKHLYLTYTDRRRLYGNTYWGLASRFIAEAGVEGEAVFIPRGEKFKVGVTIIHPEFGKGKIIKATGFGEDRKVEVVFTGGKRKKLAVKYANLQRI
ncbi:MAG TPA: YchF/TatD family DNA exonuclease [bacterium]|nr:YchF/TatD family DNA exonuclease [bacterium]